MTPRRCSPPSGWPWSASDEAGSVGWGLSRNLLESFDGEMFAVNPAESRGLGPECVGDVADGAPIDVVVVAVPPTVALEEIRQAVLGRARERRLPVFLVRTDTRTTVDRVEAVISTGRTSSAATVRRTADRLKKSADLDALPGE